MERKERTLEDKLLAKFICLVDQDDQDADYVLDQCGKLSKSVIKDIRVMVALLDKVKNLRTKNEYILTIKIFLKYYEKVISESAVELEEIMKEIVNEKFQEAKEIRIKRTSKTDKIAGFIDKLLIQSPVPRLEVSELRYKIEKELELKVAVEDISLVVQKKFRKRLYFESGKKGKLYLKEKLNETTKEFKKANKTELTDNLGVEETIRFIEQRKLRADNYIILYNRIPNNCRCNHKLEPVKAILPYTVSNSIKIHHAELNAFYCNHCRVYFTTTNDWYEQFEGQDVKVFPRYFNIDDRRIHFENGSYKFNIPLDEWNEESFLHRAGYNASSNGPSQDKRREILKYFVDNESKYADVLFLLDIFIKHRGNQRNAVEIWKSDRSWLTLYVLSKKDVKTIEL